MKNCRCWNGTHTEKKDRIEEQVKAYRRLLCGMILVIGTCMFLAIFAYVGSYNQIVDSIYSLQELWDELNGLQEIAEAYILTGRAEYKEDCRSARANIERHYRTIENLPVGKNYSRNLADLIILIRVYEERVETVMDASAELPRVGEAAVYRFSDPSFVDIRRAVQNKHRVVTDEVQEYFQWQRASLGKKLRRLLYLAVLVFTTGLLLISQNTFILTRKIVVPLTWLTRRVQEAWKHPEEEQAWEVDVKWGKEGQELEEIEVLHTSFQEMFLRIQEQIRELKESMEVREQLKEQEMENLRIANLLTLSELHCLQMQMNPHFLFNTLNMIQQTVYLDKKEKTSELLRETAAFLRYSLDYIGKNVRLGQELEALGNYVTLQEERLGERIMFEFILDERLNTWYVPCLILQPLVENSILHGMAKNREGALVTVRTELQEETGNGYIYVEDNGEGISTQKLAELRKSLSGGGSEAEERIGLHNVARRLALFEGGREELQIDSEEQKGTTVTIILYRQGKEEQDAGADCG